VKQCTTAEQLSVDRIGPTVAAGGSGPPPTSPDVSVPTGSATGTSGAGSTFPRPGSAPPRGRSSDGRSAMTTEGTTASPTQDIGSTVARLVASAPPLSGAQRTRLRLLLTEASGS